MAMLASGSNGNCMGYMKVGVLQQVNNVTEM